MDLTFGTWHVTKLLIWMSPLLLTLCTDMSEYQIVNECMKVVSQMQSWQPGMFCGLCITCNMTYRNVVFIQLFDGHEWLLFSEMCSNILVQIVLPVLYIAYKHSSSIVLNTQIWQKNSSNKHCCIVTRHFYLHNSVGIVAMTMAAQLVNHGSIPSRV
jgi:hypothetical protein